LPSVKLEPTLLTGAVLRVRRRAARSRQVAPSPRNDAMLAGWPMPKSNDATNRSTRGRRRIASIGPYNYCRMRWFVRLIAGGNGWSAKHADGSHNRA
jgi:hypothetical protein